MRKLLTVLFVLGTVVAAGTVQGAVGTVDMSWDNCSPIVTDKTSAAPGQYSLFVSVLGHDENHKGYQVQGILGTAAHTTPDAWAFEPVGCQGTALIALDHLPSGPVVKTCPAFQGGVQSVQVKAYDANPAPYDPGLRRFSIFNVYPDGFIGPNPAQRYFLARIMFDHTFSVAGPGTPGTDCGGFENAICMTLVPANLQWLDDQGSGVAHPFNVGQQYATFNNAGNPMNCAAVPTRDATWGQIKSQYRH